MSIEHLLDSTHYPEIDNMKPDKKDLTRSGNLRQLTKSDEVIETYTNAEFKEHEPFYVSKDVRAEGLSFGDASHKMIAGDEGKVLLHNS